MITCWWYLHHVGFLNPRLRFLRKTRVRTPATANNNTEIWKTTPDLHAWLISNISSCLTMWSSQCVCQFLCLFLLNKIFVAPILLFIFPRIVSVQWDFGAIWYVFILFLLGIGASMSFPLPRWKAQGAWTRPGVSARQRRCGGRRRNNSRAYRWPRKRRSKCSPWHWMMVWWWFNLVWWWDNLRECHQHYTKPCGWTLYCYARTFFVAMIALSLSL